MISKILTRLLFPVLVAVPFAAIACGGGGDTLSLEEYFKQMESISQQAEQDSSGTETKYEEDVNNAETEEEMLALTVQFFEDGAKQTRDAFAKVREIKPPSEAKDAHNEFVAAADALVELFDDIIQQARDAKSAAELQDLSAELDSRYSDVTDRVDRACTALQELADANSIDVDLECEGGDGGNGGGAATPGGGDATADQDLEDYFTTIEAIFEDAEAQLRQIADDLNTTVDTATSDAAQVQAFRDAFERTGQVIERALLKLGEIDIPARVEDAHSAFVDSKIEILQMSAGILDDLADLTAAEEIQAYFDRRQPELDDITAASDETCFDLQAIADDHGIDVDLNCED